MLVVVGGHCRGPATATSSCWTLAPRRQHGGSSAENGAPALSGHTATVLRAPGAAQDEGVILFLGGEEGLLCLENVSVRSLRAWSADATARASTSGQRSRGGAKRGQEDARSAEWQAALRRLDELEVVTAEIYQAADSARGRRPDPRAAVAAIGAQGRGGGGGGCGGAEEAFRRAILTWHPDVMMRRLGGRLAADGYDAAYAVVTSNSIRVLEAAERLGAA